jgi:hypothetical protein
MPLFRLLLGLALLSIALPSAYGNSQIQEVNLYNKEKEAELCIELNQRTRTKQLTGGSPDLQPAVTPHGLIYWNPKVYAYATYWYSDILLKVRVLSQLLSYFRDLALSKGQAVDGTIPVIAFAQREKLISPEMASQYTQQSGELQMYFNQNKNSFDSLAHPLPWPQPRQ